MKYFSNCLILLAGAIICSHPVAEQQDDPRIGEFNQVYAEFQSLAEAGRFSDALPKARKALELGEGIFGDKHKNTAALTYNYGYALLQTDDGYDAKPVLSVALRRFEAVYGKKSEELIPVLMELGEASFYPPRKGSDRHFRRALKLIAKHEGSETDAYAQACLRAGALLMTKSRQSRAKDYLDDAYQIFEKNHGADHLSTSEASFFLGKYWLSRNKMPQARDYFLQALVTFDDPNAPSSQIEMSTHAFLVNVYENMDQSDNATEHCLAIGRMSPIDPDQDYRPLFRVAPEYPKTAERYGVEGIVDLRFTVDENGFVRDPTVVKSAGGRFNDAAFAAVEKWRYAPKFVENEPVATEGVEVRLSFRFDE